MSKAVFFDFDETLVHADPPVFDTLLPACARVGLHFDAHQVRRAHRFLYHYFSGNNALFDYERFGKNLERFYHHVTQQVLVEMGTGAHRAWQAVALGNLSVRLPKGLCCPPEAYAVLEVLKREGASLGVISNNEENIVERCRAFGFDEFLDFVITRRDAGCSKPDPRIFEMALRLAGVAPTDAVHVGDNYYADVVGAQNAGIRPVLVDPHGVFDDADCAVIGRIGQLLNVVV